MLTAILSKIPGVSSVKSFLIMALAAGALFAAGYGLGRWDGRALTDAAVAKALEDAAKTTEKAINELSDEADRSRVRRYICVHDRGGVWSFAENKCTERKAQ